jgi:septum formation protein
MLTHAGVAFEAMRPGLDEDALKRSLLEENCSPVEVAERLAAGKALSLPQAADALVIGSDTTLDLDGQLFDKPASLPAARAQLSALRGREHRLHSAAVLVRSGETIWRDVGTVRLRMRGFSDPFLDAYLAQEGEAVLSSVGAYRFEGLGAQLFERVEGDYFAVLGLPLLGVLAALRREGALPT